MSKNVWCNAEALLEAKKWLLKPREEQMEDRVKDIVTKELVDNVMNQINQYNKQVNYGVKSVEDIEQFRKVMVENIVKLCLDKIL